MTYPFAPVGPPYWDERPVAIVGAGPSLTGFDFERLRGPWHILAIKQKYLDLPFADAVFGLDMLWLTTQSAAVVASGVPAYFAAAEDPPPNHPRRPPVVPGAHYLRRQRDGDLLSVTPDTINHCGTSGFGGLNLAVLKRAKTIVLFGYDYNAKGHDRPEQYPWSPPGHNARYWPRWAQAYDRIVPQLTKLGVVVYNACPNSVVRAFPKVSIEEGLQILRQEG